MVANLKDKHLTNLVLTWSSSYENLVGYDEAEENDLVLKYLQPPPCLKRLKVGRWNGVRFPQWGMDEFPCLLPNLVSLSLRSCHNCQELPAFSRLPHLRFLRLWDLNALEYVETGDNKSTASAAVAYFPSLETMKLWNLPKLKGWSRKNEDDIDRHQSFARLSELGIEGCPKLVSMPLAPNLESLEAYDINDKLLKHLLFVRESPSSASSALKELYIGSVHELVSLSINLLSLKSLTIWECEELVSLIAEAEYSTSIQRLEVDQCSRLRHVSGALQHLSVLEELEINDCQELDLWGGDGDTCNNNGFISVAWQGFKSLRSLKLSNIQNLDSLPRGLGCVTMLQKLHLCGLDNLSALPEWIDQLTHLSHLEIEDCNKLSALPGSFSNLTSLQKLEIQKCPDLRRRCVQPDGDYWHLIRHIPHVKTF